MLSWYGHQLLLTGESMQSYAGDGTVFIRKGFRLPWHYGSCLVLTGLNQEKQVLNSDMHVDKISHLIQDKKSTKKCENKVNIKNIPKINQYMILN